ncbi:hypothetical protein KIF59_03690 [Enterobacter cloacae subsp. cloacae]|nr:hypothetical protein [Enterobacter cloacae subsp. cloacae]
MGAKPDAATLGTDQLSGMEPSPLKTAELLQADMAQAGVKAIIVPVEGRFRSAPDGYEP